LLRASQRSRTGAGRTTGGQPVHGGAPV